MALPLTAQQQEDVDLLLAEFQAWRAAFMQAIRADNDPTHELGDARARAMALSQASNRLNVMLTFQGGLSGGFIAHPETGAPIIPREPIGRGFVRPTETPSALE